ncbi:MAG: hypothetical protein QOE96_2221, partial [Blastocatellia bacterium]|nr:hypothetical protein [Blastocatellia bacterium]
AATGAIKGAAVAGGEATGLTKGKTAKKR